MVRIQNNNQKFILNLIYITFVFSLVYIFALEIGLDLNNSLQMIIVALGSLLVKFFLFNPIIFYILLVLGFIITALVHYYYKPVFLFLAERTYLLLTNIYDNLRGKENISPDNIYLFWGLLIVLVALYTGFILFKDKSIYLLLPVYILPFLYYWYNYLDVAYWMIAIFILGFLVLLGLDKYSRFKNSHGPDKADNFERLYPPWIKTVISYSILILFLSLVLPKKNTFIHWPWLQDKVYTYFPGVENLRSHNSYGRASGESVLFNFSSTGFQENITKLGGPVNLSNKTIMIVFADGPNYLRGNVKHAYNGDYWTSENVSSRDYKLNRDFSRISRAEKEMYYEDGRISIRYKNFASPTIFSPYRPEAMSFTGDHPVWISEDFSISFPNGIFQNETYVIHFQKPLPYGILISRGIDRKIEEIDNIGIYLQVPEERISERTKSLTKDIVSGASNDFEKALAIEEYLRNNFEYNLDVDTVPMDREFVDYFLFDGKEGYCTYYATAMAIMLRLEGIPSRYVEGYLAHEEVDPGVYEVSHRNAHAWVEAFIEPVGWMKFEPTPAFPVESRMLDYRHPIGEADPTTGSIDDEILIPPAPNDDLIVEDRDIILDDDLVPSSNLPDTSDLNQGENTKYIIFGILLLILPIRFIIDLISSIYEESKARKLPNDKRIIYLYKDILHLTKLFGHPQLAGETHYEYANRVAYRFHYQNQKDIKEITNIFVKSKYGSSSNGQEDILALETFRKTLQKHLKSHLGIFPYYYRRYVKKL